MPRGRVALAARKPTPRGARARSRARRRRRCATRTQPARSRASTSHARQEDACITEAIAAEVSAGGYRRFDKQGRAVLRPDLGPAQVRARQRSRMPRSTGCAACSTAVATRATSRGACCAWHPRTSATRTRARLTIALEACEVYERLGSPEGELAHRAGRRLSGLRAEEQRRV